MLEFKIDEKITGKVGSNKFYAGVHWSKRKAIVDYWHKLTYYSMLQQKVPKKLFKCPVAITLLVNSKLDIDNHGFLAKLIIDALKGYLIEEDSRKFVNQLTIRFHDEKYILVKIEENQ